MRSHGLFPGRTHGWTVSDVDGGMSHWALMEPGGAMIMKAWDNRVWEGGEMDGMVEGRYENEGAMPYTIAMVRPLLKERCGCTDPVAE